MEGSASRLTRAQLDGVRLALEAAISDHINAHADGPRQRTEEWLALKDGIVGGSELATIMGLNPYSSREKLLARKIKLDAWSSPGIACWWGTMFEPVSERLVELECGTRVVGTDIHITNSDIIKYHGNSPDGYCVLLLERVGNEWQIACDPTQALDEGRDLVHLAALIELKAPYRRLLKGQVPKYYVPQIWSGLLLAPAMSIGLYAEMVYRLCSLDQLGPTPDYSIEYHGGDKRTLRKNGGAPIWEKPLGWGITAVYAPLLGTRAARGGRDRGRCPNSGSEPMGLPSEQSDADLVCYRTLCRTIGHQLKEADFGHQVLDLGEVANESASAFDQVVGLIDKGELVVRHSEPVLLSGCGASSEALEAFHVDAASSAPRFHYLFGLIPWKVQQVDYHLIPPQEDFAAEIQPPLTEFMDDVRALREADDRAEAFRAHCAQRSRAPTIAERREKSSITDAQFSDVFSMVS